MADQGSIRIALTEENFSTLVNGGTVKVESKGVAVEIALSDIGFELMARLLESAMRKG